MAGARRSFELGFKINVVQQVKASRAEDDSQGIRRRKLPQHLKALGYGDSSNRDFHRSVHIWIKQYDEGLLGRIYEEDMGRKRLKPSCNCDPIYVKIDESSTQFMQEGGLVSKVCSLLHRIKTATLNIANRAEKLEDRKELNKRTMTVINSDNLLGSTIADHVSGLMPGHRLKHLLLLESQPGVTEQDFHMDFNVKDSTKKCPRCDSFIPLPTFNEDGLRTYQAMTDKSFSFIVAIQNGTTMVFDEHIFGYQSKISVGLSSGDVAIWKSSTIHAGAGYDCYNRRIFGVFEGTGEKHKPDEFKFIPYEEGGYVNYLSHQDVKK
jgi:hypothetical protein